MKLKILLADDSMTAQAMGKKILSEAGYDVVAVSNGAAAIKKIPEIKPDLVLLDVYMPGYSGLEVCQQLRGNPQMRTMPVLLTVGKLEAFRPEEGIRVKADGVIIKPFEATDLIAVVGQLADRVRAAVSASQAEAKASKEPALRQTPEPESFELQAADEDEPLPEAAGDQFTTAIAVGADNPDAFTGDASHDERSQGEEAAHPALAASGSATSAEAAVAQHRRWLDMPIPEELMGKDLPAVTEPLSPHQPMPAPVEPETFEIAEPQLEVAPQVADIEAIVAEAAIASEEWHQSGLGCDRLTDGATGDCPDEFRIRAAAAAPVCAAVMTAEEPPASALSATLAANTVLLVAESFPIRLEPLPPDDGPAADPWPSEGENGDGLPELCSRPHEARAAGAAPASDPGQPESAGPVRLAMVHSEPVGVDVLDQELALTGQELALTSMDCKLEAGPECLPDAVFLERKAFDSMVPQIVPRPEPATVGTPPLTVSNATSNQRESLDGAAQVPPAAPQGKVAEECTGSNPHSFSELTEDASERMQDTDEANAAEAAPSPSAIEDRKSVQPQNERASAETPVSGESLQASTTKSEPEMPENETTGDPVAGTALEPAEAAIPQISHGTAMPDFNFIERVLAAAGICGSAPEMPASPVGDSPESPEIETQGTTLTVPRAAENSDARDVLDTVTTALAEQLADRVLGNLKPQLTEEIKKILRGQ